MRAALRRAPLWLGLAAVAPAAAGSNDAPSLTRFQSAWILSGRIERAPVGEVLAQIGRATGIKVRVASRAARDEVEGRFTAVPLRQALSRLLDHYSYVLVHGTPGNMDTDPSWRPSDGPPIVEIHVIAGRAAARDSWPGTLAATLAPGPGRDVSARGPVAGVPRPAMTLGQHAVALHTALEHASPQTEESLRRMLQAFSQDGDAAALAAPLADELTPANEGPALSLYDIDVARKLLERAIETDDHDVQRAGVEVVVAIHTEQLVASLAATLDTLQTDGLSTGADPLAALVLPTSRGVLGELVASAPSPAVRRRALWTMLRDGEEVPRRLVDEVVGSADPEAGRLAREVLVRLHAQQLAMAVASAAYDTDPQVREIAIVTLEDLGRRAPADLIQEVMSAEPDPALRMNLLELLADTGRDKAFNGLTMALNDPDPQVRSRAGELLEELRD